MIVIFQSPASGDVIMFGDVAKRMMKLMGKEPSDKGIVTVEQLPAEGGGSRPYVSLTQRAVPLLELLEWSLKKRKPVVWGV